MTTGQSFRRLAGAWMVAAALALSLSSADLWAGSPTPVPDPPGSPPQQSPTSQPSDAPLASGGRIALRLDRFGQLRLDGRAVWPDQLPALLAERCRSQPNRIVELAACPDAIPADVQRVLAGCHQAGIEPGRVRRVRWPADSSPSVFPVHDSTTVIDLLTGQWRRHGRTLEESLAGQLQWFAQLQAHRRLVGRQWGELTDYVSRVAGRVGRPTR